MKLNLSRDIRSSANVSASDQFLQNLFVYALGVGLATFLVFVTVISVTESMFIIGLVLYAIAITVLFIFSNDVVPMVYKSYKDAFKS